MTNIKLISLVEKVRKQRNLTVAELCDTLDLSMGRYYTLRQCRDPRDEPNITTDTRRTMVAFLTSQRPEVQVSDPAPRELPTDPSQGSISVRVTVRSTQGEYNLSTDIPDTHATASEVMQSITRAVGHSLKS